MAIKDDLRKTLTDPTPLYFAAGTAELAYQQAKKVPGIVEQLRSEAPARFESVRQTDPKDVQDKATTRAKEAQATLTARVNEIVGTLDADLKKFGESAQEFALRGVGYAAEAAVKARETYEKVAEHGEEAVKAWRGEAAEEISELAEAVEPDAEPKPEAKETTATDADKSGAAKKTAAKKTTPAKKTAPAAKKTGSGSTPPAK
ncbi:hypothetical protein OG746_06745 [Streptomyces sp. NBC_01016]|uniref:hypothetical protein n=1 Tax=Streptomyces sp. NBC_01016 TaxID=2903720 RepID=UPI00225C0716|nr:hypothetical protein [Streptomyces sp. NBC_01016]MCX4828419.1 hypothetical protein [Streptomyces sp. NBC_01016]